MHFAYDRFNRLERPQLILCELSKQRMGVINDISLEMSIRWTDISELRFTVSSEMVGGGRYELFEDVRELRLVQVPNFGWFQIRNVNEVSDGLRLVKECTAYSMESMLQGKQVIDLDGEFRLFDPIRPHETIMGILLTKIPGWRIGNVDGALLTRWRTLNVSKQNLYTLLTNDIATAYECLFIFDYENLAIDIVEKARQFKSTSIFMSYQNLIKNSNVQTLTNNIVTALHVHGGNLDITGVNPNGTDVLYNVDYFKNRMSAGLLASLAAYENRFRSLQPTYSDLLVQLRNTNRSLALLQNNPPQYEVRFNVAADGTAMIDPALNSASGLNQLEALRRALEGVRGVRIEHGNIPYTDINNIIAQVNPMITARQNSIAEAQGQITNIQNKMRDIVNQLRMENNFTEAQWIELNRYFVYDTFQEDGFVWTDIMTEEERQIIQQELFELGGRVLEGTAFPKYEIRIDSVNFPALPEFEYFTEQFELGTTFTLDLGHFRVNPLLLEVNIDFDDLRNFSLVYANQFTLESGFSDLDGIGSNVNAANTISFNLARLEAMRKQHDDVTAFINGALDASRNELISSPTRTAIEINENGLRARSFDWNTGQPIGLESWLTGSQLAFSDDAFMNARLALGRINNPGRLGGASFGLVGDVIVGKILAGNSLHIESQARGFAANPQFIVDENGARLNNASLVISKTQGGVTNQIILDPLRGFEILRGAEQQVFLGADGNVHFRGTVSGGSINIGNGAFAVDSGGNVTILRGNINIGNGQFAVNSVGNVTARHITITGGFMRLGNTEISEAVFRTTNGHNCLFFSSILDASNSVHGGAVQLGTLHANRIQANSITASQMAANSITANQLAANSVTANALQANSVTANAIAANSVTANAIAANSVTANAIAAGAISANMITAGTMSADRISGGVLQGIQVRGVWGDFLDVTVSGLRARQIFITGENSYAASRAWVMQQTLPSDIRDKVKIKTLEYDPLKFINKLRPIQFIYKFREQVLHTSVAQYYSTKGKDCTQNGFIAQEVEEAANLLGFEFTGIKYDEENDIYTLKLEQMIAPIVGAIQQLSQRIDEIEGD